MGYNNQTAYIVGENATINRINWRCPTIINFRSEKLCWEWHTWEPRETNRLYRFGQFSVMRGTADQAMEKLPEVQGKFILLLDGDLTKQQFDSLFAYGVLMIDPRRCYKVQIKNNDFSLIDENETNPVLDHNIELDFIHELNEPIDESGEAE